MISIEGTGYDAGDTEHLDWIQIFCVYLSSRLLSTINTFKVYRD
jgi:hypothetical protein